MKRKSLTIILSISVNFIFAQGITITGHVISNDLKLPIAHANVIVISNDSVTTRSFTDSTGFYKLHLKNRTSIILSIYKFKTRRCGQGESYMNDRNEIDLSNTKDSLQVTRNFILERLNSEWELPILCFKKNTTTIDTCIFCYDTKMDSALFCLVEFMRSNPTTYVSIDGYAEKDEKDPDKLSFNRARTAKKNLLQFQIEDKRIKINGMGTKKPNVQNDNNRMVTFLILKK
jgi:hypothetical protein